MHKPTHSFMFVLSLCAVPVFAQAQSSVDVKEWKVPWEKSGPRDPFAENKNSVWFVGQRSGYLARLDVETGYFTKYAMGRLGVVDPGTEAIREWIMPSGETSRPYSMAADFQDRLWMVASGVDPNLFVGFDPANDAFFSSTPVPSGGRTVRHMHYYEPSGTV